MEQPNGNNNSAPINQQQNQQQQKKKQPSSSRSRSRSKSSDRTYNQADYEMIELEIKSGEHNEPLVFSMPLSTRFGVLKRAYCCEVQLQMMKSRRRREEEDEEDEVQDEEDEDEVQDQDKDKVQSKDQDEDKDKNEDQDQDQDQDHYDPNQNAIIAWSDLVPENAAQRRANKQDRLKELPPSNVHRRPLCYKIFNGDEADPANPLLYMFGLNSPFTSFDHLKEAVLEKWGVPRGRHRHWRFILGHQVEKEEETLAEAEHLARNSTTIYAFEMNSKTTEAEKNAKKNAKKSYATFFDQEESADSLRRFVAFETEKNNNNGEDGKTKEGQGGKQRARFLFSDTRGGLKRAINDLSREVGLGGRGTTTLRFRTLRGRVVGDEETPQGLLKEKHLRRCSDGSARLYAFFEQLTERELAEERAEAEEERVWQLAYNLKRYRIKNGQGHQDEDIDDFEDQDEDNIESAPLWPCYVLAARPTDSFAASIRASYFAHSQCFAPERRFILGHLLEDWDTPHYLSVVLPAAELRPVLAETPTFWVFPSAEAAAAAAKRKNNLKNQLKDSNINCSSTSLSSSSQPLTTTIEKVKERTSSSSSSSKDLPKAKVSEQYVAISVESAVDWRPWSYRFKRGHPLEVLAGKHLRTILRSQAVPPDRYRPRIVVDGPRLLITQQRKLSLLRNRGVGNFKLC